MIELFEQDIKTQNRQSSKGNQLKWRNNQIWYKADALGYEGYSEYIVSNLLRKSTLDLDEFVLYKTQEIKFKSKVMNGCESENFLKQGWEMITLERLFMNYFGSSLYRSIFQIQGLENRVNFIVEQVERMTGLKDFGLYLSKLITIDALFLNEDRHTHNIAVLLDGKGDYHYCPIFDQGASLLSDCMFDYPFLDNLFALTKDVKSKTFERFV